MEFLSGKKTYLVAIGLIVWAIGGALLGQFDWQHAIELALGGAGLGALRAGVEKA